MLYGTAIVLVLFKAEKEPHKQNQNSKIEFITKWLMYLRTHTHWYRIKEMDKIYNIDINKIKGFAIPPLECNISRL